MNKDVQAKDISDGLALTAVEATCEDGVSSKFDIEDYLEGFPHKVVLAKLRALVKRGVLGGCPCGCRGDFYRRD